MHDHYTLNPNHRQDLQRSGLSQETIQGAGVHSETNHATLAAMLNRRRWPRKYGAALVFPFRDETGAVVSHRVKPDNPPIKNDKPAKYLSPSGAPVRAYVPPGANGDLSDPERVLLVTEGEKKTLKATQEGFACVGLAGVDCWHGKKSSALIPDLARIAWKDRRAFLVFDSDAVENQNVKDNESLLAAVLANHGATVKIVRLPAGPEGAKVGLDDYLVAHDADALWRLLDQAEDPEAPDPEQLKQPCSAIVYEDEAKRFLHVTEKAGHPRLIYWCETFWWWSKGRFRELRDAEVRSRLVAFLEHNYLSVSRTATANVLEHIKARCIVLGENEPPVWLADAPGSEWSPQELLCCRNEIVHLPSLMTECEEWSAPPTPALFNTSSLDFDFVDDCPRPDRWLQFLGELWPDDPESVALLQTWFGYCLTPDTRQHKLLTLIGPKRSGKTTIAKVLRALVGRDSTAAPTLSSLSSNFGLSALIGKTLAVIGDARLSGRPDAAVIVERLLSITGEDAITVDRKHLPLVTVTFPTRIVILSNELPRLADASGTLASRMIVLRLTKSWLGQEDKRLAGALMRELPGVLWWAVDGWRRLQESDAFAQPESGAELLAELENLTSPVGAFLRQRCVVGPEHTIARADLYAAYQEWCESQGRKHVEEEATFGRNLYAAVPGLRASRPRVAGKPVRHYVGLTLQKEGF